MARPPTASKRFTVTLPEGAMTLLNQLVSEKELGETPAEVARFLIIERLQIRRQKRPANGD